MLTLDQLTTKPTPDVDDSTPTVNHYVKTVDILRSIVDGIRVRAVCGERFVVQSQGGGRTDSPAAVVCPACQSLYEQMRPE